MLHYVHTASNCTCSLFHFWSDGGIGTSKQINVTIIMPEAACYHVPLTFPFLFLARFLSLWYSFFAVLSSFSFDLFSNWSSNWSIMNQQIANKSQHCTQQRITYNQLAEMHRKQETIQLSPHKCFANFNKLVGIDH